MPSPSEIRLSLSRPAASALAGAALMLALILAAAACMPSAEVVQTGGPTIQQALDEPATGGKMRVAVMRFENKTGYDVGQGMRSMLTSALFRTGRFIVVERQMLDDVLLEQRLADTGIVSKETGAPIGEVEGAQLLIFGTITEFAPAARGLNTAVGGVAQSEIAIDIRIVDSRTSRILSTTTVKGKTSDITLNTGALKYLGASPLLNLEVWNNTSTGSAIRLCLDKAVAHIVSQLR
jgi:curli biogenesis system outer membrane secretion channel CsgG